MDQTLSQFEDFCRAHQFTIAAVGAMATLAAVVVSLITSYVALRSSRTQIRATVSLDRLHHSSLVGQEILSYLVVSVSNIGSMPASIPLSFFRWKLPFMHGSFVVLPLDYSQADKWIPQKQYPFEIKPRGSASFYLSDSGMFRTFLAKELVGKTFWSRLRSHFVSARMYTDDRKSFNVKIYKNIRDEIRRARSPTESVTPDQK